ncbi:TauD-domain-containing protein [Tilletiaria anomala UBC 951]|uniref:TauD-domain-containing protein n=1 Tax=Tilletiaria anomala (strain ATCC 24038 / CBS 436.72 / UBC 951) TaxID=1037660 RepID=A0A066VE01_TILAU|nr:TauD-domain-containing protein [Tilletiaria anomala UBC 951]KDN39696.1 TauD-domain-containing protein [Tilletiaria anomala UBC 951]
MAPGDIASVNDHHKAQELDELARASANKQPLDWDPNYKYRWALPWFDERYKSDDLKDPPYEPFEHSDVGLRALKHPDPRAFLKNASNIDELSPRFGSVVKGLDLAKLTLDEKDELALFVAERGVVILQDQQGFIDQTPEQLKDFGRHYSARLHQHQVSGQPREHSEFHLIYKSAKVELNNYEKRLNYIPTVWHSDVSYEAQPPGLTVLFLFDTPPSGGDTLFADSEELLRRLSPPLRALLETLTAEHSGYEQSENAKKGGQGVAKRLPVSHSHPIVRTHPVTGRQSLYVNKGFTTKINGLKKEESDALLDVLFRLNADAVDAQVRVRWQKGSVALFDNRRTLHTPIVDFTGETGRRHGARITPAAEKPFFKSSA